MLLDEFLQRKKTALLKLDKSSKGKWDQRIVELCKKINQKKQYYTTSSCSGRIVVMIDEDKKSPGLFIIAEHGLLSVDKFNSGLLDIIKNKKYKNKLIKFKQQPAIIHVACKTLKDAKNILSSGLKAAFKRSGIISSGKRFIVELNSTEKLEFPIIANGKLLIDNEFLKIVVDKSNKNLKKSWEKIKKLEKLMK